jgi:hypothetical protein
VLPWYYNVRGSLAETSFVCDFSEIASAPFSFKAILFHPQTKHRLCYNEVSHAIPPSFPPYYILLLFRLHRPSLILHHRAGASFIVHGIFIHSSLLNHITLRLSGQSNRPFKHNSRDIRSFDPLSTRRHLDIPSKSTCPPLYFSRKCLSRIVRLPWRILITVHLASN